MEGGGSILLYRKSAGELGVEASNMGIEGSDASITTRRSKITRNDSSISSAIGGAQGTLVLKRKRGRPRKYDANGNFIRRPSVQAPSQLPLPPLPPPSLIDQRGCQQQFHPMGDVHADISGTELTPYVIQVSIGEDVIEKILASFQAGPICISILSATGMVYSAVIRQPNPSSYANLLKYEGIFEILRLSGSFNISEDGKIQTGGISVLLSRINGHVIGGTLGGSLLAATPVQMVVGSFIPTRKQKHPKERHRYGLRMRTAPNVGRDPQVKVTSHEPAPIPVETNDGWTSYNKEKPRGSSLVPEWNVKPSPDLNVDASIE